MGYTDLQRAGRRGAHRAGHTPNRRRQRTALLASTAALATALLGAAPALATDGGANQVTAAAPALRWQAVDAAQQPVTGATFEVQRADARDGDIVASVTDNTGQADYSGLDRDPAPGVFSLGELRDAKDASRTETIATGDALLVRLAPGDADEPAGAWEEVTAGSADAATEPAPVQAVRVDPATPAQPATPDSPATPDKPEAPGAASEGDPESPETAGTAEAPESSESTHAVPQPQKSSKATLQESDAQLAPRAAGPDAPGVNAPYVYWRAVDSTGALLSGAKFEIQGPIGFWSNGTSYSVTDCTSAPCTGLDRDPDAGEFQVKFLTPANNPTSNGVVTSSAYRVRQTAAPDGYQFSDGWRAIPQSWDGSASWGGQTYNFGDFVNTPIPPAKLIVSVGGDRTSTGGVSKLKGVTLLLNTNNGGSPSGTRPDGVSGSGDGWAKCVSDTNGECTFSVPNTESKGANRNKNFWVVQPANGSPAGWYANPKLSTGTAATGASTDYRFQAKFTLASGNTYRSTTQSNFMVNTSDSASNNNVESTGVWQQSRNNPALAQTCGIDVALILDFSGSVANAGAVQNLKDAAGKFVDALVGTPSRMSLFTFSEKSPATQAGPNQPALSSVATAAQANALKSKWTDWKADGGTNWDEALATAAASGATQGFDVAVVITDGQPTRWGPNVNGPGNRTRFVEVENGIFSANKLKEQNTKVIAFGVGDGVTGANNALNLRAISGTQAGTDYYQTSNYETAGNTLRALAQGACKGQLTVTKMIVPNTTPAGQITGATPAPAGWNFVVSDPTQGVTLPNPATRVTEDDGTGTVAFPLTYGTGVTSGAVTVAETQQPGYQIVPVGGKNAVCTNLVTNKPVTPINDVTNGVRVAVPQNETVNCTVYNRAPDQSATVQVDKVWRVLDENGTETGRYRIPGDEGSLPQGLGAQLTLTGPGSAGATPQQWGTPRSGYAANNTVTLAETTTIDAAKLPGCTVTSQQLTKRGAAAVTESVPAQATLTPGANTFEMTNTVTCTSKLTLLKEVSGGTASPAGWDLTAAPQGGGQAKTVSGANTRSAANTFAVTPAKQYALSEALHDPATPLAYLLDRVERCVPDTTAPGGCDWTRVDESAPVSVGIGQHEVYRFVNVSAPALEVPLTGGVSSDALNIAGAGLAALALLVGSLSWAHRRRRDARA